MFFNTEFLDNLSAKAKANPRLRQAYDLRTHSTGSGQAMPEDNSQRMLNALEPGTIMPIHRHRNTSETMVMVRGKLMERFYSLTPDPSPEGEGKMIPVLTQEVEMRAGGEHPVVQIEAGQWHSLEVLESGTIIFEAKDGKYEPLGDEDQIPIND